MADPGWAALKANAGTVYSAISEVAAPVTTAGDGARDRRRG